MPSLSVTNKCNNNCVMCTNPDPDKWVQDPGLESMIMRVKKFFAGENTFLEEYGDTFALTGGEPTIFADLVKLMLEINRIKPQVRIQCLTNGRMFAYEKYAKSILSLPLNLELIVPIHGTNEKKHDAITRVPGSFLQTLKGLNNIFRFKKDDHKVELRWVIHRLNYKEIPRMVPFAKERFPKVDRVVFIFFEIEGQAEANIKNLRINYYDLSSCMRQLKKMWPFPVEVRFYHFPLCVIDSQFFPLTWRTLPQGEVVFLKKCNKCYLKEFCLGIPKAYLRFFGNKEFNPPRKRFQILKNDIFYNPIRGIVEG